MIKVGGWWLPDNEHHLRGCLEHGAYQAQQRAVFIVASRGYRLAIDVGAHVGTWSRRLSHCFDHVVAFEPIPDNVECLRKNAPKVQIEQCALGEKPGTVSLAPVGDNTGATYVADDGPWQAEMRTLDSYELSPDAIKLDVEGFELAVLRGAKQTIKRCWPVICVECKRGPARYGLGQHDSLKWLEALGYDIVIPVGEDFIVKKSMRA